MKEKERERIAIEGLKDAENGGAGQPCYFALRLLGVQGPQVAMRSPEAGLRALLKERRDVSLPDVAQEACL